MLTSSLRDSRISFPDFINIHSKTLCTVLLRQLAAVVVASRDAGRSGQLALACHEMEGSCNAGGLLNWGVGCSELAAGAFGVLSSS